MRTKMTVRGYFGGENRNITQNIPKILVSTLRFSSCSRLHAVLFTSIVKKLHGLQTFHWDFLKIRQKLPVLRTLGRLHGLRDTNEWRRRRTAAKYFVFIWNF